MKVYLSQLMRGKSQERIISEREAAVKALHVAYPDEEIEVLTTFLELSFGNPLLSLGQNIAKIGEADLVAMLPAWQDSRRCRIEHDVAEAYSIALSFIHVKPLL